MNQKSTLKDTIALFVFLASIGVALVIILTTFRGAAPGSPSPTQGTITVTVMTSSSYPGPEETQTVAAIVTLKAILEATYLATTPTPFDTQVPIPTGTREGEKVKFSGEKLFLDALNAWGGYLNGNTVVIYAGSLLDDPKQGAIALLITLPYRFFSETVLTPTKHGGVRVVAEQNNRLTLQAADGEIFYFDVPARRFVASLTEVVATATPPPTYTPYAPTPAIPMATYNPYPMPTEPGPGAP